MMRARPVPVVRKQLGAELRRLREARHLTVTETAHRLGWSESKLSRVETGHSGIRPQDLDELLDIYDVDRQRRDRLQAHALQGRQRARYGAGDSLPDSYETLMSFEADASVIKVYEAQIVPGLLQTAEYAAAVMRPFSADDDPDQIAERVAVRMARAAVLTRVPPPQLSVVLDEAVLHRPMGGADVMRRQLLRLVEASERPMVTIQVLPYAVGAHRALTGSFVVMEFAGDTEPPLAYSEGLVGGVIRRKPDDLQNYTESFEALRAMALSPAESVAFIASLGRNET